MTIKVGVCGAAGKMGRAVLLECYKTEGIVVTAAVEAPESEMLGVDVGELINIGKQGIPITDDIIAAANKVDVMIDFTLAPAVAKNLPYYLVANCKLVIGTTGLNDIAAELNVAAQQIPIVEAPNMSAGVNLCLKLLEVAAKAIGEEADIEIIEAHHRHKKDAPSGTALKMGEVITDTLGRDLKSCAVYGREGMVGERPQHSIGFETIRAGDIVGEHTVMFAIAGERIEIIHKASSRTIFAKGAVKAARWLMDKTNGLFAMEDVLRLEEVEWKIYKDRVSKWRWRHIAPNGRILGASSEGYKSESDCISNARRHGMDCNFAMRRVLRLEDDEWEIYKDKKGEWRWRCISPNGRILGASSEGYKNTSDCMSNAKAHGMDYVEGLLGLEDEWEIYKDKKGEWRWNRIDCNGKIVGVSLAGYKKRSDCISNAKRHRMGYVQDVLGLQDKWKIYKDKKGEWRWNRTASNGRTVGASLEGYKNKSDCINNARIYGMDYMRGILRL